MDKNRCKAITIVAIAAFAMCGLITTNIMAQAAKKSGGTAEAARKARVVAVRRVLYGVKLSEAPGLLKKAYGTINDLALKTTKDFNGVMFVLGENELSNVFSAMGGDMGMAEVVKENVGLTMANGVKGLPLWRVLPSVVVLAMDGRGDAGVAKIFDQWKTENFEEVLTAKRADVERYGTALGYLMNVYAEPAMLAKMAVAYGYKDNENDLAVVLGKKAQDFGYAMTGADGKTYVSLGYASGMMLTGMEMEMAKLAPVE